MSESEFFSNYEKHSRRIDNLFWKKNPNWYLKFKKFDDEIFKEIEGFLGFYFISNYGQIISFYKKEPVVLKYVFLYGYFAITLSLSRKRSTHLIHNLVYHHFISPLNYEGRVIHKNKITTDNYYKNLKLYKKSNKIKIVKGKRYDLSLFNQIEAESSKHSYHSVKVVQFDKKGKYIKEYSSLKMAAIANGLDVNLLRACCCKKNKTARGYQWRYRRDPIFKDGIKNIEPAAANKTTAREVLQFDLNGNFIKEYPSIRKANIGLGLNILNNCISKCANAKGNKNTAYGFQWKFKNDPLFSHGICKIKPVIDRKYFKPKKILQFDKNGKFIKEYPSAAEAARDIGISHNTVIGCVDKEGTAGGFQWRYKKNQVNGQGPADITPAKEPFRFSQKKPVLQFCEKGKFIKEYQSLSEAERELNISKKRIINCVKRRTKSAGGFQWYYKDNPIFKNGIIDIPPLVKKEPHHIGPRPVIQFHIDGKLIREYSSIVEAAKECNIKESRIYNCASGIQKVASNFQWRFKDNPVFKNGICNIAPVEKKGGFKKPVLQFDLEGNLKKEYSSISEAVIKTGINFGNISSCLHKKTKTAGGYQWRFKDDQLFKKGIVKIESITEIRKVLRKKVLQFDLKGKFIREYSSFMDAARALRINAKIIGKCIHEKQKTGVGYQWRLRTDPMFKNGIVNIEPIQKKNSSIRETVFQYDMKGNLINEFKSLTEAVKKSGISRNRIRKCAIGKTKSVDGFIWKFKNEE